MIWPFASLSVDDLVQEPLTNAHVDGASAIHAKTFRSTWSDGDFLSLLGNRHTSGIFLRKPLHHGGNMVGFVLVRTVVDEAEILTIAVAPNWQQYGVGRALMQSTLNELRAQGVPSLFLEVVETNRNAIKLYKRLGFEQVAVRKNYYDLGQGVKSNALVMRCDVG